MESEISNKNNERYSKFQILNSRYLRTFATIPIWLYQKTLSPDHGIMRVFYPHGACRFYPTCSEYTRQAVIKYGVFKGYYKGLHRVVRCNPWSDGGVDKP